MTIALIVIAGIALFLLAAFAGPISRSADNMPKRNPRASEQLEQQRLYFRR